MKIKSIPIKDEDLPKVMEALKSLPNTSVRRFIVEGHNGKEYWHNEFDEVVIPSIIQTSDIEIVKYLLKECSKKDGYQLYSIQEVKGNHSILELKAMAPEVVSNLIRPLYYNFFDEPLESFRETLQK